jgi:hypothetical protein
MQRWKGARTVKLTPSRNPRQDDERTARAARYVAETTPSWLAERLTRVAFIVGRCLLCGAPSVAIAVTSDDRVYGVCAACLRLPDLEERADARLDARSN